MCPTIHYTTYTLKTTQSNESNLLLLIPARTAAAVLSDQTSAGACRCPPLHYQQQASKRCAALEHQNKVGMCVPSSFAPHTDAVVSLLVVHQRVVDMLPLTQDSLNSRCCASSPDTHTSHTQVDATTTCLPQPPGSLLNPAEDVAKQTSPRHGRSACAWCHRWRSANHKQQRPLPPACWTM